jgi:hypothetical protein
MNITISLDDQLLERARKLASRRGTSVQELFRTYLEGLVGQQSGESVAGELLQLMNERGGHSGGRRIRREEAYEGRT